MLMVWSRDTLLPGPVRWEWVRGEWSWRDAEAEGYREGSRAEGQLSWRTEGEVQDGRRRK